MTSTRSQRRNSKRSCRDNHLAIAENNNFSDLFGAGRIHPENEYFF
jgi:hypothetical protein